MAGRLPSREVYIKSVQVSLMALASEWLLTSRLTLTASNSPYPIPTKIGIINAEIHRSHGSGIRAVRLIQGDCLEVMPTLADGSVDLILCDLPYGTTACAWDAVIPFELLWAQYLRIAKNNAPIILTASQPFTSALVMSRPMLFRHEWIWSKNFGSNFANTVREPFKEHESVLVFSRAAWTYNMQRQPRSSRGLSRAKYRTAAKTGSENTREFPDDARFVRPNRSADRVPSSVQRFNCERGLHPTQKPVALMEYLIRTYTNPGAVVLDNCMGSGTTGVACQNTGRDFIGIERDEKYFAIAKRRIHEPNLFTQAAE